MRKEKMTVLAMVLAGCMAFGGCASQAADGSADAGNIVTGTVECKEVYVRAKIAGYLTDIPITEGQEVSEGDLLFSSDRRDVEVKQTQAAGTVSAAAGQMEAAEKAINAAQALIDKATANVTLLETEYVKYQELYAMDAVAEDTMDKLTTQLEAARLDMQAAMAQKEAAEGQYQAAAGQLSAAQGVLAEVNLNLDQTSQYAPCNGTVTMISSSVGELIGSGTTIVTLTDYSDRWIMANVDEYAIGKLEIGQELPLTSKAYPDTVFHGTIVNVSKNPDFAIKKSTNELNDQDVVTYAVKIALSEEDDITLYPGMLVSVDLDGVADAQSTQNTETVQETNEAGEAE